MKLEVEDNVITTSDYAVIMDQCFMHRRSHTVAIRCGRYFQLYNIQKAFPHLTDEAAATANNAFVASRLDYGLPNCSLYNFKIKNPELCISYPNRNQPQRFLLIDRLIDFIYIRQKPEKAAIAYLAGDLKESTSHQY